MTYPGVEPSTDSGRLGCPLATADYGTHVPAGTGYQAYPKHARTDYVSVRVIF